MSKTIVVAILTMLFSGCASYQHYPADSVDAFGQNPYIGDRFTIEMSNNRPAEFVVAPLTLNEQSEAALAPTLRQGLSPEPGNEGYTAAEHVLQILRLIVAGTTGF